MPNPDEIPLLSSDDSESEEATLTKKHRVELPPCGEGGMEGENPDEIAISPSDSDEERTPVNRPGGDSLQGSGMEGGGDSLKAGVAGSGRYMSTVNRTPLSLPRPEQTPGTDTLVGDVEGGGKGGRGDEDGKEGEEQRWSGKQPGGFEDVALDSSQTAGLEVQGGHDCHSSATERSSTGGGGGCGGTYPRIKRRNLAIYAATEEETP